VGNFADDFAVKITGTITIPTSGIYTFGVNASDGLRLKIGGVEVISKDARGPIPTASGKPRLQRAPTRSSLWPSQYYSGEALELFAAPGSQTSFTSDFKLVGDTANGGLAVQTTSGASTVPGFTVRQVLAIEGNSMLQPGPDG